MELGGGGKFGKYIKLIKNTVKSKTLCTPHFLKLSTEPDESLGWGDPGHRALCLTPLI